MATVLQYKLVGAACNAYFVFTNDSGTITILFYIEKGL